MVKHIIKIVLMAFLAVSLIPMAAQATPILVGAGDLIGSRSTPGGSGVIATDGWTEGNGGFMIFWDISPNAGIWNYSYTFTDDQGNAIQPYISHMLLEVSPSITPANADQIIFNVNGGGFEGPKTWAADSDPDPTGSSGANNGNPLLPANLYAVKFDFASDPPPDGFGSVYSFDSTRAPIWGDFYTKDGKHEGILATAWNSGFGTDPGASTTDFTPWIPTPDTTDGIIPEPGTLILLSSGLVSLLGYGKLRFRRKKNGD